MFRHCRRQGIVGARITWYHFHMKKLLSFDLFISALKDFESGDSVLYPWPRNRIALIHCLAERLSRYMEEGLYVDMAPSLSKSRKTVNPDIIVHNRRNHIKLAVVCRNGYLSEAEQKSLVTLARKCDLVMAVSFFTQKSYMLLYMASGDRVEYFHFDRNTLTAHAVRKKLLNKEKSADNTGQLSFNLR